MVKIYNFLCTEAKTIREKVFMEEQGFKDEFDDLDDLCQHLVVFGNNQPIGTCRFYYDESLKSNVLGRIGIGRARCKPFDQKSV